MHSDYLRDSSSAERNERYFDEDPGCAVVLSWTGF